ncbi:MAG: spermidine synthase [Ilumatobacteraceae bacterium]
MSRAFEQLDHRSTPMGDISLRRRLEPTLGVDVWEVKLGDEFLMSSLFTTGEEAVAHLGLAALGGVTLAGHPLDVVVGGLGLGHTAWAALQDQRVGTLHVIEALEAVIAWHRTGLVPLGATLDADPRCRFVHADFFATIADGLPFGPGATHVVDAILVDIDHTPSYLLNPSHGGFYRPAGIRKLLDRLRPGGVFALWSDLEPNAAFLAVLVDEFATAIAEIVTFPNFYTGDDASSTVYVATTSSPVR